MIMVGFVTLMLMLESLKCSNAEVSIWDDESSERGGWSMSLHHTSNIDSNERY